MLERLLSRRASAPRIFDSTRGRFTGVEDASRDDLLRVRKIATDPGHAISGQAIVSLAANTRDCSIPILARAVLMRLAMSEGMNTVILLGNLGADPELRQTHSGAVLKMRLATTRSYVDKDNQKKEQTDWHSVTVFGRRGEGLAKVLRKGSRILVNGRLHTSSYEKEGQKHYATEVIAEDIFFAGGRRPDAHGDRFGNGLMPRVPHAAAPPNEAIPF